MKAFCQTLYLHLLTRLSSQVTAQTVFLNSDVIKPPAVLQQATKKRKRGNSGLSSRVI